MKLLLSLTLGSLAFTPPTSPADPPATVIKSIRMAQIADRYHLTMAWVMRDRGRDYWTFMESKPGTRFPVFPVVVPKDATDRDAEIAQAAAENAVTWCADQLKAQATPTPADGAFTMPTHPPGEVER